jgi:hypothetical protein
MGYPMKVVIAMIEQVNEEAREQKRANARRQHRRHF